MLDTKVVKDNAVGGR